MHAVHKMLARASGKRQVSAGETVVIRTDTLLIHDAAFPFVLELFSEFDLGRVWDPDSVVIVFDHYQPPSTTAIAETERKVWEFARRFAIRNVYPGGCGIEHQVLPEMGHVWPGSVVLGSDTDMTAHGAFGAFSTGVGHPDAASILALGQLWVRVPEVIRVTLGGALPKGVMAKDAALKVIEQAGHLANYRVVEFDGPVTKQLTMDGRTLLCNVVGIRLGAKAGYIEPDSKTLEFLNGRVRRPIEITKSDARFRYAEELDVDCASLQPLVMPPNAQYTRTVPELEGTEVTQAFIGTCVGGQIEDLRIAASMLRGKKVKKGTRLVIVPSSREVYSNALDEGLISVFVDSGAMLCPPGCGPCFGHHSGVLGPHDVCISAGNRNNVGEMGHPESLIYIASSATVAASAIEGKIADPRKYL